MISPTLRMILNESCAISTRAPTGIFSNRGDVVGKIEERVLASRERARRSPELDADVGKDGSNAGSVST
jgi:hypothetical protein